MTKILYNFIEILIDVKKKIVTNPSNLLLILWLCFGLLFAGISFYNSNSTVKTLTESQEYLRQENLSLIKENDSLATLNEVLNKKVQTLLDYNTELENKKQIVKVKYEIIYKNLDTIHAFGLINEFKNVFSRNGFK